MKAVSDVQDEQEEKEQDLSDDAEEQRCKDLIRKEEESRIKKGGTVKASLYSELVKEADEELQPKKNCILGFWRKCKLRGNLICYRMIRIDRPLFLKP